MKKILVIGDVIIDRYVFGNLKRKSPEADMHVFTQTSKTDYVGGAGYVARVLECLGMEGNLMGDVSGRCCKKTRFVVDNEIVFRADKELSALSVKPSNIDNPKQYSAVILSDYNKGALVKDAIPDIMDIFIDLDIPIIVDPKFDNIELYQRATVVKLNEMESKRYISKTGKSVPFQHNLLITQGKRGMFLISKDLSETVKYPSAVKKKDRIQDVIGAGDAVAAGLAIGFLYNLDIKKCCEFASKVARGNLLTFGTMGMSDRIIKELQGELNRLRRNK